MHFELQQSKKVLFTSINSLRNIALSSFVDLLQSESPFSQPRLYTFVYDSEEESRCFTAVSTVSKMLPWRAVAFHFVFIFPSVPAFVFLFIHLFPLLDKSHPMLGALLASAQPHSLNIVVFKSRRYGENRQI